MKQKASIMRYLIVAMLTVMCAVLCFVGCKDDGQGKTEAEHTVTWNVAEHATVKAEGYDTLPEKVKDGTAIVFTIECDSGYEVDTVKRGDRNVTASNGKYTVTVTADVTISVTVKQEIQSINVTTKPTKNTYFAGETLDKAGMVVEVEYVGGSKQTLQESDYRIVYQGGAASSAFALGDTYFKVSYGGKESENVPLDSAVSVMVTLDLNGGTLAQAYQEGLKANTELSNVKLENGVLSFTYAKALTADVTLPVATDLTKGEEGDYTFVSWKLNGEGDGVSKLSKDNAVSVVYQASWDAHLFDFVSIGFEMKNDLPHLVVKGTFKAATSLYALFTEGNRHISYKAEEKVTGARGEEFTLEINLWKLTEAKAQDGGSFVGPWLDLKFGYDVDGRTETMELPYDKSLETVSITDAEELYYRFGFAQFEGALKVVITMLTPYTYEMHVANTNDVLTLTIDGQIREKLLSKFTGKTAKMDWWITSTVTTPDSKIAADGKFQFKFELSPEKGFALDTLGYAHFKIVDENGTTLYKDGEPDKDGNLLANALTNRNELEQHNVPHGDFGGVSLMVSNADGTLVYYVGIPNWDAIVIYGWNPLAPRFTSSGQVELKVDDIAAPTKVYFVIKITIENLTDDEVDKLLLGNTDGDINVFASDAKRNTVTGNVYTLWFDVTAYSGSQLWPNLYFKEADDKYTKMGEFGGDSNGSTNGLYAIVNNVKYSIKSIPGNDSSTTYGRPCLVTGTPASGETNPPETDPNLVKKELVIDGATFTLVAEGGKPYVKVTVSANGFASADELKSSVQYGNFDAHDKEKDDDDFEWKTPCAKVETTEDGKYTLWFDISDIKVDNGKLYSNLFLGNQKIEIKDTAHTSHGVSITVGETVYTVECAAGSNGTWDIPCITLREVGAPEYAATGADIVLESNKVYFVVSGTYANYEDAALKTVLDAIYFDLQQRGGSWNRYNSQLKREVVVENGVWSIKFDVTSLPADNYTAHFDSTDGVGGQDSNTKNLQLADRSNDGKSLAFNGQNYMVVNKYGEDGVGDDQERFWGNIGLTITTSNVLIQNATLEQDGEKVYVVLTVKAFGELKNVQFGDKDNWIALSKTVKEGNYDKLYFEVTDRAANGAPLWCHLTIDGKNFDGSDGNIYAGNEQQVVVGGKTYHIQRHDGTYWILQLIVT